MSYAMVMERPPREDNRTNPSTVQRPRVLIVDDELPVLLSIKRSLRDEFDIETAMSGRAALQTIANQGPFAALMADMRMPEMDGVATLQAARLAAPETPRIMLTGDPDQATAARAINTCEVFRYLNKPCSVEMIRLTLRDAVREHKRLAQISQLQAEDALNSITDALFTFSDAGSRPISSRSRPVFSVLQSLRAILEPPATARQVQLVFQAMELEQDILADHELLVAALSALAAAALRRLGTGGRLTMVFETLSDANGWSIDLIETPGQTTPSANVAGVQRPYSGTKEIALARAIAEMHGGCLIVSGTAADGMVTRIELNETTIAQI